MEILNLKKILGNTPVCGEIPSRRELTGNVLTVAWPSMLEMLLTSMINIVDTAMVSTLGEGAIAAVGITTQPKFIGLCFFIALGMSVSALTARRKGEEDEAGATQVLRMALVITLIMSAIVSSLFVIFALPICRLAGAGPDIDQDAAAYLRIIMGGLVFMPFGNMINAAQRGCGNTRLAMRTNITSNLVNVCLNYLLIGGHLGFPALGIRGAAIATVCGTAVGCGMSVASLFSSRTYIHFRNVIRPEFGREERKRNLSALAKVGGSSFAEQIFMRVGFFLFSLMVAKLGTLEMASHVIGMNIMTLSFCIGDGLQTASVALSGQNLGRKRPDLSRIYAIICQRVGFCCTSLMSVLLLALSHQIFDVFSDDPLVLGYGPKLMTLLCPILIFQVSQMSFGGVLRSAGDNRYTAMVSLISITLVRVSVAWFLCYGLGLGLVGAWLGIVLQQILTWILYRRRFRQGKWIYLKV